MKKQLNTQQESELFEIREWCHSIIDFFCSIDEKNITLYENFKEALSDENKNNFLQKVSPSVFIKGLRQAKNDINEWASYLPKSDLESLNEMLRIKFGKDLHTHSKDISKQISTVLKRGKINNDDEFRLIEEKVGELCESESELSEIDMFNKLLLAYEDKKKKS